MIRTAVDTVATARLVGAAGCQSDRDGPMIIIVKILRRALSALALAGALATAMRVRGTGGTPPQHGGWRPLELPDK